MFMLKFGSTLLYVCHIVCIEIESYEPIITSISGSTGRLGICTCVYGCSGVWERRDDLCHYFPGWSFTKALITMYVKQ